MKKTLSDLIFCVAGAIVISLFAQLSIEVPWSETSIPISGQTLAVLVVGMVLGAKLGVLSVILYLLLGGFGLPIFADGAYGWETFQKGSAGFLYGFVIAAGIVGFLAEQKWDRTFTKSLLAMTIGTLIIMACGVLWLTNLYGFEKALAYGFTPFIPGAIIKILIGSLVVFGFKKS